MRMVVDTSALIAVVSNEPAKPRLIEMSKGIDLVAPASVHWEVGNAIAAGLKRRRFEIGTALAAIQSYNRIRIRFFDVPISDAVVTAQQLGLYAYDAYVVACAKAEGCPILTLDRALARAAQMVGVEVPEVMP